MQREQSGAKTAEVEAPMATSALCSYRLTINGRLLADGTNLKVISTQHVKSLRAGLRSLSGKGHA